MNRNIKTQLSKLSVTTEEVKQISIKIQEMDLHKYIGDLCGIKDKTVGAQLRMEIPLNWKVLHECRKIIKSLNN